VDIELRRYCGKPVMKTSMHRTLFLCFAMSAFNVAAGSFANNQVKTASGVLEGSFDPASGVHSFKGIPFAQPPIGQLRWKPPVDPVKWQGVRKADKFGPRAMQRPIFGDMMFRSDRVSEDCLYLNVWTPAHSGKDRLPVLVYFYGGGFAAGDGSENRYDGESMARRGIVSVTVNYRLNVFGFFAHPELTKESPHHASGNYGLMDQTAALRWVYKNISAFGGDPKRITIAGESAGSISVSAHMASPLSKHLFSQAIGESGSLLGTLTPAPLAEAEQTGLKFATNNGWHSLAELRALPADKLLESTAKPGTPWFSLNIDGYFFPEDPAVVFGRGKQAAVPLLVGWNSEEMNYRAVLGGGDATLESFEKALQRLYPKDYHQALKVYAPSHNEDVIQVATDLASDRFIAFSTWRWADCQNKISDAPVYRYYYARPRPAMRPEMGNASAGLAGGVIRNAGNTPPAPPAKGAVHSAEIEYALGNLPGNTVFAWTPEDFKVSETMQSYFANFIKTGNPNVKGLPEWPPMSKKGVSSFMRIDVNSQAEPEQHTDRYHFLETNPAGK
jgi:para-nitrobenzyl esterase